MELVKILTIFTTIDVMRNKFEGKITEYIGNLVALRHFNLSHNDLTGSIPSLIGKMSVLEALDPSFNHLEGEIPQQLSSIYTLARLNLSHNQLSGHIPQGPQFSTFDNDSYIGNTRLCGNPLSRKCENDIGTPDQEEDENDNSFSGFTWEALVIGYSCGVVPTFSTGYLMLSAGKPKWLAQIIAWEQGLKIRRIEIQRQN
ncbi:receptor-like protein 9DC3 [Apium graveolens]|uniref:receptor-like protein 9DC3 n=1 Tax=Apium graveolens TaxID=4045 RepID=UPI003D7A2880